MRRTNRSGLENMHNHGDGFRPNRVTTKRLCSDFRNHWKDVEKIYRPTTMVNFLHSRLQIKDMPDLITYESFIKKNDGSGEDGYCLACFLDYHNRESGPLVDGIVNLEKVQRIHQLSREFFLVLSRLYALSNEDDNQRLYLSQR